MTQTKRFFDLRFFAGGALFAFLVFYSNGRIFEWFKNPNEPDTSVLKRLQHFSSFFLADRSFICFFVTGVFLWGIAFKFLTVNGNLTRSLSFKRRVAYCPVVLLSYLCFRALWYGSFWCGTCFMSHLEELPDKRLICTIYRFPLLCMYLPLAFLSLYVIINLFSVFCSLRFYKNRV